METNKEKYKLYLSLKLERIVSYNSFCIYLSKYGGFDETIEVLSKPSNKGKIKIKQRKRKYPDIEEASEFAEKFSVAKASSTYNIPEGLIYKFLRNKKGD